MSAFDLHACEWIYSLVLLEGAGKLEKAIAVEGPNAVYVWRLAQWTVEIAWVALARPHDDADGHHTEVKNDFVNYHQCDLLRVLRYRIHPVEASAADR